MTDLLTNIYRRDGLIVSRAVPYASTGFIRIAMMTRMLSPQPWPLFISDENLLQRRELAMIYISLAVKGRV